MNLFITVGTTKFDPLLDVVSSDQFIQLLARLKVDNVLFQIGRSTRHNLTLLPDDVESWESITWSAPVKPRLLGFRFSTHVPALIAGADLLVCHAGAGTLLEALQAGVKTLAVSNHELMRNHQADLGRALQARKKIAFVEGDKMLANPKVFFKAFENWVQDGTAAATATPMHSHAPIAFAQILCHEFPQLHLQQEDPCTLHQHE